MILNEFGRFGALNQLLLLSGNRSLTGTKAVQNRGNLFSYRSQSRCASLSEQIAYMQQARASLRIVLDLG
ncbi:MAG TPA: hypothetical protein VK814_11235 [Acidobacteriaceae bacterium]|jgi:hypothetical protein|nr:hypothetical protein [Acidobacteriaceae bacterium]